MSSLFHRFFSFLPKFSFLRKWVSFFRLQLMGPAVKPAPLGQHLRQMKKDAEELYANHPMEDKFSPAFLPSDGPLVAVQITCAISFYFTTKVFIKRQPHADELGPDIYGNPRVNLYIDNRLRNEAAALRFINEHTSIPVPQVLDLWEENGLVHLKTGLVDNGIELRNVDEELLPAAIDKVTVQLETEIIPQLQQLRRSFIGSADPALPVVVPHVLWAWKDARIWPRVEADTDKFVFVHTDLDRQNILVDPSTFRIVSIIDWETAGFSPQDWELPKWKVDDRTPEKRAMQIEAKRNQQSFFGPEFVEKGKGK